MTKTTKTRTTRQPVRALAQTSEAVSRNAAAEKARKAASKAALLAEIASHQDAETPEETAALHDAHVAALRKHEQQLVDAAAHRGTLLADAAVLGLEGAAAEAYADEQMAPPDDEAKDGKKTPYSGPMFALRSARKSYVAAANGILCCGDVLATICGEHDRATTVQALVWALSLPGNPYLALNPGQQSMNLRNKARHALKNGTLTMAAVVAAFSRVTDAAKAA